MLLGLSHLEIMDVTAFYKPKRDFSRYKLESTGSWLHVVIAPASSYSVPQHSHTEDHYKVTGAASQPCTADRSLTQSKAANAVFCLAESR